jgi:hypothetical protein
VRHPLYLLAGVAMAAVFPWFLRLGHRTLDPIMLDEERANAPEFMRRKRSVDRWMIGVVGVSIVLIALGLAIG